MTIRFGSVCSGIEAASVALHPLGWQAAWFAEIERFPAKVLAHHYPDVPNLGDMRKIARQILTGGVEAPDALIGGTPCQAFSIAGLREGLDDERGQLTLAYVRLLDAIDFIRGRNGKRPAIAWWENVPGVLSSKDNAFGCFLAGLAGEDVELVPPRKKWANAGCVFGPTRTVAWRVLDAQYFGVAQRRRRVFVVASARKDCDPAKILFEFDGVRRDSAPSREAGQETAGTLASRTGAGGFPGTDEAYSGYLQAFGGGNTSGSIDVATCLTTSGQRLDFDTETFAVNARQDPIHSRHYVGPLDTDGSTHAIAFSCKDCGADASVEITPTMRAMGHAGSHANAGGQLAVRVTGDITHTLKAEGFDASEDGTGRGRPIVAAISVFDPNQVTSATNRSKPTPELAHTLPARADPPVAFQSSQSGVRLSDTHATLDANNGPRRHNGALVGMAVRRLMPTECEALQAFPRGYTGIPGAADGPRYKALGNSMCVNVMAWIGRRIAAQLKDAA